MDGERLKITTSAEIGEAIRGARLARGWTQEELANRIGTTRQWVIALEGGTGKQRVSRVMQALRELGLEFVVGHDYLDEQ